MKDEAMTEGEQQAVLSSPHGIRLLMDYEDARHCELGSMEEQGDVEPWPTKRWASLREKGRSIIMEDPEVWEADVKQQFGF
jgi:hypothetical protein